MLSLVSLAHRCSALNPAHQTRGPGAEDCAGASAPWAEAQLWHSIQDGGGAVCRDAVPTQHCDLEPERAAAPSPPGTPPPPRDPCKAALPTDCRDTMSSRARAHTSPFFSKTKVFLCFWTSISLVLLSPTTLGRGTLAGGRLGRAGNIGSSHLADLGNPKFWAEGMYLHRRSVFASARCSKTLPTFKCLVLPGCCR